MQVKIKKIHDKAVIPSYAKEGDAGMDLIANSIIENSGVQITFGVGLAFEIPLGYVGYIFPRSSIRNTNLSLANSVGVVDSGYRGEVQVTFNKSDYEVDTGYNVGDKVAQIIIMPVPYIEFLEFDELGESERGEGGFGHTGK